MPGTFAFISRQRASGLRSLICCAWHLFQSWTDQLQMAAVEWTVTMREGLRQLSERPESIYLLRYENLLREPVAQLERLLTFCELPPDAALIGHARRTLKAPGEHRRFDLDPAIKGRFLETLTALDYASD